MNHFGFPADICFIFIWGTSLCDLRALFRRLKFLHVMRDGELVMLEEFSETFLWQAFSVLQPGAGEGMVGSGGRVQVACGRVCRALRASFCTGS